jgi:hypothetical protein
MEDSFLDMHKDSMETLGFWSEQYKSVIIKHIENMYKQEVIREWCISDVVFNGEKILLKWNKRYIPLTNENLKERYGS